MAATMATNPKSAGASRRAVTTVPMDVKTSAAACELVA
jgi:hypothetical protein